MPRILALGVATLDVINEVDGYPAEDDEVRAVAHRQCRGGNAANFLTVLSQFGHECYLASTLPEHHLAGAPEVLGDLWRHEIDIRHCRRSATGTVPTSYILVNLRNGSRTIVHCRQFPELEYEDFARIRLDGFDWVHFEGRNIDQTERMMTEVAERWPALRCSLEVEKARTGIEKLFPFAEVILFSASYARARGFTDGVEFLRSVREPLAGRTLVCSWGDRGAYGVSAKGEEESCPAVPPERLVETLGAGDVFNAGVVDGLLSGQELGEALARGCGVAGRKCGKRGFDGLVA